jgi:hypothetical protein
MAVRLPLKIIYVVAVLIVVVAAIYIGLTFVADTTNRSVLAALVGGAATFFAGWLAWESVISQAQRADGERLERAAARKEDARIAIAQPIHAAAAWLSSLQKDLLQQGDRSGKSLRAKRHGRQLDESLDQDLVVALLTDLSADDRANLLMIVGTMRTALAMGHISSEKDELSHEDLGRIKQALIGLAAQLSRFDEELHSVYLRDAGLLAGERDP